MTSRPPLRRNSGQARRPTGPRRRSAALSPVRAAAALVALLSALAIYGVGASSVFAFGRLEIEQPDALLADADVVRSRVRAEAGTSNLFLVRTDGIAASLRDLPTVTDAQVTIQLPDTIRVRLNEREPILVWIVGERRFLADREGALFAVYPADRPGPTKDLPSILDRRAASRGLAVGSRLDPVDIDAATRLGSLTPADIGSAKEKLRVAIDDTDGFTVIPIPGGPPAVFGFYTPSLRTPELIPGQVRLLRELLRGREAAIRRVVLASDTDGTYTPRATPSASPSPSAP